ADDRRPGRLGARLRPLTGDTLLLRLDAVVAEESGVGVIAEEPLAVIARLGEIRTSDTLEPPAVGDIEDVDAAETELAELALQAPDPVAALEPGRLAGFIHVLVQRPHAHLARVRPERRRERFAEQDHDHEQHASGER